MIVAIQLWEQGDVARWLAEASGEWAYALCFGLVWFDAIIPIFPGETTLSAASTLAAEGDELELGLVMLAGALGAIVGDSSLFWIARKSAAKVQGQLDNALENQKLRAAWDALDRSPGLMIVAGRYVPMMRFAVNASMGLSDLPYRRFLLWSVVGGVLLVGVHVRAELPGRNDAFWLSACIARHLLAHNVCGIGGDLLRRSTSEQSGAKC